MQLVHLRGESRALHARMLMRGESVALAWALVVSVGACTSQTEGTDLDGGTSGNGTDTSNGSHVPAEAGPKDTRAPTFAGVETAKPLSATRASLTWQPAQDDTTPPSVIAYRVYVAPAGATMSFDAPAVTTPAGATGLELSGLAPGKEHSVVVRAVDASGNEDANTTALTIPASGLPTPALTLKRLMKPADTLYVAWAPATDDPGTAAAVAYELCWGAAPSSCGTTFEVKHRTEPGVTDYSIHGLPTHTTIEVFVRSIAPGGLTSATASGSVTTATSYATDVLPMLNTACNKCHNGGYAPGPFTRTWLLGHSSGFSGGTATLVCGTSHPMLTPFDATKSFVHTKMTPSYGCATEDGGTAGSRMPPKGAYDAAHDAKTKLLGDWIDQGALDN